MADGPDAAIAELGVAREEFLWVFAALPDDALGYRAPGDECALGGLAEHLALDLLRSASLVRAMAAGESPVEGVATPTDAATDELLRDGPTPAQRPAMVARLLSAESVLAAAIRTAGEAAFAKRVAVAGGVADGATPASPADIVDRTRDHVREHAGQLAELVRVTGR